MRRIRTCNRRRKQQRKLDRGIAAMLRRLLDKRSIIEMKDLK